jgi:hypothetical protein
MRPRARNTRDRRGRRGGSTRAIAALAPVLACALALGATAGTARAQTLDPPRGRQGYYVGVGYHFALDHNWEDGESWGVWHGADLTIRMGQMVTRRFGLGLQIHFGGTTGDGQRAAIGGLGIEAQWELYRNLALQGGAGVDVVSLSSIAGPNPSTRGTVGSGYFLGLGYDWFLGHRLTGGWAATPLIQARFVPGSTTTALIGIVGLQLTYWTGLPRNQLELPPDQAFERQK